MLNRVILMGRITQELELKTTASGKANSARQTLLILYVGVNRLSLFVVILAKAQ